MPWTFTERDSAIFEFGRTLEIIYRGAVKIQSVGELLYGCMSGCMASSSHVPRLPDLCATLKNREMGPGDEARQVLWETRHIEHSYTE